MLGITYSLTSDEWAFVGIANALLIKRKAAFVNGTRTKAALPAASRLLAGASAMKNAETFSQRA